MNFLVENFYFLVNVFTGLYALVFIAVLGGRIQHSLAVRRFAIFLVIVYLWSIRDITVHLLHPHLSSDNLRFLLVALSPVYLLIPVAAFAFLSAMYNSAAPRELQFKNERLILGILLGCSAAVFVGAMISPTFLYNSFEKTAIDYVYAPGPGLRAVAVMSVLASLVPCGALMAIMHHRPRAEATLIIVGVFATLFVVLPSSLQPIAPLKELPRLGCLGMFLVSFPTAFALFRFEPHSTARRMLAEKQVWKDVGLSLKSLTDSENETAVFQNLCDNLVKISDSVAMAVVTFVQGKQPGYQVRAISQNQGKRQYLSDILPLMPGIRYSFDKSPGLYRAYEEGIAQVLPRLENAFMTGQGTNMEAKISEHFGIRQILLLPIRLDKQIRGAVVLLRNRGAENAAMFEVFSVQCSLVMRFSEYLRNLESGKKLEEQYRQSQKMEAIGLLAGGIAHDFNNLLAGISGFAGLLKRKHCAENEQLAKYVDPIIDAAGKGAELTKQLLAFARKGNYQKVSLNLHQLIESVSVILERTIDKRITILKHLDAESDLVLGDPSQLENALLNLGLNARDAMPSGGELQFRTSTSRISEKIESPGGYRIEAGTYLQVEVTDTGIGMDEETRERVFEPFFTTKEKGKGTGLGLAGVYGCVKNHDGYIQVESRQGTGTCVSILLPVTESKREASISSPDEELVAGKGHILVIDDEKAVREVTKEILEDLGYRVSLANDGVEGIELYRSQWQDIDLVVVDMVMPRMAGYECHHGLRQINKSVKVLVTTGYCLAEDTQRLAGGIAGFLRKPFGAPELSQAVSDALAGTSFVKSVVSP